MGCGNRLDLVHDKQPEKCLACPIALQVETKSGSQWDSNSSAAPKMTRDRRAHGLAVRNVSINCILTCGSR